jgi:hypothetical protein
MPWSLSYDLIWKFKKDHTMVQSILTAIIVLVAFIFVLMPLFTKKKPASSCHTCSSGGCGGCPLSEAAQHDNTPMQGSKKVKN